jgi:hypothetical protein
MFAAVRQHSIAGMRLCVDHGFFPEVDFGQSPFSDRRLTITRAPHGRQVDAEATVFHL